MRVALGIPFWGDEPARTRAYWATYGVITKLFPFDEVIQLPPGLSGRGASRNYIAQEAHQRGCDVVVICDADTIPEPKGLRDAIYGAHTLGGQHFPYESFRYLSEYGTALWYDNRQEAFDHCDMEGPGSYGGVFAMRPEEYWAAGGFPQLEGWGFEDIIFVVQTRTLIRDAVWHPGSITHLWHPSAVSVGSESYCRNLAICQKFEAVDRNPEALKALMIMGVGMHVRTW